MIAIILADYLESRLTQEQEDKIVNTIKLVVDKMWTEIIPSFWTTKWY